MNEIQSNQNAIEYSDIEKTYNLKTEKAIDDMLFLKADVSSVVGLINKGYFSPIVGTGSPEGIIASNASLQYIDTALSPVSVTMWVNTTINSKTNWIPVI